MIDEAELDGAVSDLPETFVLPNHRRRAPLPLEHAAALGVVRTGRLAQHAVPGRGRTVVFGRGVVIERGMGARNYRHPVRETARSAVSCLSVRCRRSWRPFFFAGGCARAASPEPRDRPPAPVEANGGPLSERSATGRPCCVQDRPTWSVSARAGSGCAHPTGSRARTAPRRRSGTSPWMHHTSLAAAQTAPCAAARAGATGVANPRDRYKAPIVSPPASQRPDRDGQARTFTGPQLGCGRTDRHAPAISSDNDRTRRCGARERSESPETPSSR